MSGRGPIVVAGFGRCGTSMLMQMLQAGGIPCMGKFPAFEDDNTRDHVTPEFWASCSGHAVKILDPHRVGLPPGDARIIWLNRRPDQQARSHAKFLEAICGLSFTGDARRQLERNLVNDRPAVRKVLAGRPVLVLGFEEVLAAPVRMSGLIADFLGGFPGVPFHPFQAAAAVRHRPSGPNCAPDLGLELALVQEAMAQHG